MYTTKPVYISGVPSVNTCSPNRYDRRQPTPCRLPPINPPTTTKRDYRATSRQKNTINITPSRVLTDITSQTKATPSSRRTDIQKTIHDKSQKDERQQDRLPSLAKITKKYQHFKVYGTPSWREDVKSTRTRETTKATTREKKTICKEKNNKKDEGVSKNTNQEISDAATPNTTSTPNYSVKTMLSLDPINRRIPSRIPVLMGNLSKQIPPRAPVYPHPLRYFAGELIEKEYQKLKKMQPSTQHTIDHNNIDIYQQLSPRRPLDAFEQTMLELKNPSAAYSKLSSTFKEPAEADARPRPLQHIMTSRPTAATIDTSQTNWWIKELEICRQTRGELHKDVPRCIPVSC